MHVCEWCETAVSKTSCQLRCFILLLLCESHEFKQRCSLSINFQVAWRPCVCVSVLYSPPYTPNHSRKSFSQDRPSIHQTPFFSCSKFHHSLSPLSLPLPLSLSVGFRAPDFFPYGLCPRRSHPPCPWPSESEQPWEIASGLIYRCEGLRSSREVSRSSRCLAIPWTRPALWVSGDLVIGCFGSAEQCQRTCGRRVEIWEVCCNGIMPLFAAPSFETGRGREGKSFWFN